jgi:hypothetical protein
VSRLLAIALLVFLPFQSIWAAAAPYCGHEPATAASGHFGHHEHAHVGAAQPIDDADRAPMADTDCAACHFGMNVPLASPVSPTTAMPVAGAWPVSGSGFRSHIPSVPQPPDRA